MSYIERSLGENEVLRYRARFHFFYYLVAWGALILGIAATLLAYNAYDSWIAPMPLIIGAIVWLSILVPIWTTEIGVTNQRIIYKRGLVQRDTSELQLRSIEEVKFEQSIWGRIFNFGKLEIHGTGDDTVFLPAVADPLRLRSALQGAIGDAQGDSRSAKGAASGRDPGQLRASSA